MGDEFFLVRIASLVRVSLTLNRKKFGIFLQLQSENDVPTIAVLGSGGGFRAAIGYSGAMVGLQRSGIFDMVTYCAGLSGSAW